MNFDKFSSTCIESSKLVMISCQICYDFFVPLPRASNSPPWGIRECCSHPLQRVLASMCTDFVLVSRPLLSPLGKNSSLVAIKPSIQPGKTPLKARIRYPSCRQLSYCEGCVVKQSSSMVLQSRKCSAWWRLRLWQRGRDQRTHIEGPQSRLS